jgi:prepilin-type N-terminal cleavage/methylation domain-containing protein
MPFRTRRADLPAAHRRRGLTLIELLLSLAIGVMVVTLVFTTHRTVTSVLRGQREREAGTRAVALAEELLRQDLATLFVPAGDRNCALLLEKDPDRDACSILSFCRIETREGERDLRWGDPVHYRYSVSTSASGAPQLDRVRSVPAGPLSSAPAVTNVIAGGAELFRVQLFDGAQWLDTWPPGSSTNAAPPQLARVEIAGRTTDIFIPVGLVITSQIERAAIAEP